MFIQPTKEAFGQLLARNLSGPVVMLNLLRFRELADYSASPNLAPPEPISGKAAYRIYMQHTEPFVAAVGAKILFKGSTGPHLIGPADECWDLMLMVQYDSVATFVGFATDRAYLGGVGHRTAALADSRLLPMTPRRVPA